MAVGRQTRSDHETQGPRVYPGLGMVGSLERRKFGYVLRVEGNILRTALKPSIVTASSLSSASALLTDDYNYVGDMPRLPLSRPPQKMPSLTKVRLSLEDVSLPLKHTSPRSPPETDARSVTAPPSLPTTPTPLHSLTPHQLKCTSLSLPLKPMPPVSPCRPLSLPHPRPACNQLYRSVLSKLKCPI